MIAVCNDIEIGYDDVGSGLPIVFVHGFPHNRSLWAPQLGAFVDRCRCIAPDLRGFGESTVSPPFTIDQYADDLAALLSLLEIGRAVITGLSMGGYIAFALWRRHPTLVRALALADTRAGPDDEAGRQKRRELIELARREGSGAVAAAQITGMVGKTSREKQPDVVDGVYAMLESAPVEGLVGALQAMMERQDSTATLATITVPTLFVVGEEDVLTPPTEARAMHERVDGSRLEILEGAGHLSSLERPAAFNHVLSEFLATLTYA